MYKVKTDSLLLYTSRDKTNSLFALLFRSSMSGPHLVRKGREHRKMDPQRDFTVASPAEFVTRFGGNRVIEKVRTSVISV